MMNSRRRQIMDDEAPGGMWIPGLGENKPRPRELGGTMFGYIPDAFSNNLPTLPSESARNRGGDESVERGNSANASSTAGSSRSNSPRPETAGDSSQMRDALWQPVSPGEEQKPVQEEICVEKVAEQVKATPFFDNVESGADMKKFLIKGGKVVNDDGTETADVLVEDGVIVSVGEDIEVDGDEVKVIDATGKLVLPGGIDTSVNFCGSKLADDFASGSNSALAGGTTMVLDLVVPAKGQSLIEAYKEWMDAAERRCNCDFGLRVAVTHWSDSVKAEMAELVKQEGVNTFKVFMAGENMITNGEILEVFEACRELGAVAQVHAENGSVIAENEKRLKARGVTGPEGHPMSRPDEVEEEAVLRSIAMARQANVPLVISAGPTSKAATSVVAKEKVKGQVVLAEPTAASLALDGSHYFNSCWTHAASFVTSPPLRDDPTTPEFLVDALSNGDLHMVCSDNRTFMTADRESVGRDDFTSIPQGLNGVEDRMSVVWAKGVETGKMNPERFVAVTSANAAKVFNVYPRKGCIAEGSDADIIIWNKNNLREISARDHQQATDFNIFEGIKTSGVPEYVINRGQFSVFEYRISPNPKRGQFVEMSAFPNSIYDAMDDFEKQQNKVAVDREEKVKEDETDSSLGGPDHAAGITTPRSSVTGEPPVLNKRLGIYQRPMSAHGVRNQQDSTFSLTGCEDETRRASVKVTAPPGGGGQRLW